MQESSFSSSWGRAATEGRNTNLKFSSSRAKLLLKMKVKELLFCRILQSPSVSYSRLLPLAAHLMWFLRFLTRELPLYQTFIVFICFLHSFSCTLQLSSFDNSHSQQGYPWKFIFCLSLFNGTCIIFNLPVGLLMNLFFF